MSVFSILGGFAKVKLGRHLLTGEKVAIKIMDKLALGVSQKHFTFDSIICFLYGSQKQRGVVYKDAAY